MNALNSARTAYAKPETPVRTARDVEYDLLARTTKRLGTASQARKQDYSAYVAALNDNQQVWSTFASDVAEPGNGLPAKLRAQLFYLYEFTVEHTRRVLEDRGSVDVLVDINTAVMRGLRGEGAPR